MSTDSLTHKWLRQNVISYQHKETVLADVLPVLSSTLRPKSDIYTYDDGRTQLLLCIHGLLQISYRQASYNIPIAIWLTRDYPRRPPIPYVVPTNTILVKPGKYIDVSGRCNIDYIQHWEKKFEGCTLSALLDAMQHHFSHDPPVYSKPRPVQSLSHQISSDTLPTLPPKPISSLTTPSPQLQPNAYQAHPRITSPSSHPPPIPPHPLSDTRPPDYGISSPYRPPDRNSPSSGPLRAASLPQRHALTTSPSPPLPPPVPAAFRPSPVSHYPAPYSASPNIAPPRTASLNAHVSPTHPPPSPPSQPLSAPSYPAPVHHLPPQDLLDGDPSSPQLGEKSSVSSVSHAPPRPPNPELLHLHAAIHSKLVSELASVSTAMSLDSERLRAQQTDLLSGEPAIRDEMARLEAVRDVCRGVADRLRSTVHQAERNIAELKRKGDPEVDELVCSTTIVHNQLINLVAEDNAIEDTIYHLHRALNAGRIDLERFLRTTRILAEEQFLKRALIEKIHAGMPVGASDGSPWPEWQGSSWS